MSLMCPVIGWTVTVRSQETRKHRRQVEPHHAPRAAQGNSRATELGLDARP